MRPPFLPAEALRRVVRVSRFDGMMVLTVSGAFALASALAHDETGTLIGLAVAGTGAIELHGAALLRHGFSRGMRWLVASQLLLMAAVIGYSAWRLLHVDPATLKWMGEAALNDSYRQRLAEAGMSETEFVRLSYQFCFIALAVATFLYQGGMIIYYQRRSAAVVAALSVED